MEFPINKVYGIIDIKNPHQYIYVGVTQQSMGVRMKHLKREIILGLNNVKTNRLRPIQFQIRLIQSRLYLREAVSLQRKIMLEYQQAGVELINNIKREPPTGRGQTVHQYSIDGDYIRGYESIMDALSTLGVSLNGGANILRAIKLNAIAYGFRWGRG